MSVSIQVIEDDKIIVVMQAWTELIILFVNKAFILIWIHLISVVRNSFLWINMSTITLTF